MNSKNFRRVLLKTLKKIQIRKKTRVILRADFDVSIKNGRVVDDFRVLACIPAIKFLLQKGARLRIIAHIGRPRGRYQKKLSLRPVANLLSQKLGRKVILIRYPLDLSVFKKYGNSKNVFIFENIRFFPEEEKNSIQFAKKLARWGEIYVNEAFANSHRVHASMVALAKLLPSFAGLRLEKEIFYLTKILKKNHNTPQVAILGGSKAETKLPLIELFLKKGDEVLVGGALANNLLLAKGIRVGKSLVDTKLIRAVRHLKLTNNRLHLPVDGVLAKHVQSRSRVAAVGNVAPDESIFDVGPDTVKLFISVLRRAKMVIWNGPLGLIEVSRYTQGTLGVLRSLQKIKALKILGGGDLIAFSRRNKLLHNFNYVSTGGGAMLEFLSGKKLLAIEALKRKR